jgi:hypothetical protein
VHPTDDELRTHLAVSPCNYWPFGSHPFFQERGEAILHDAERWLGRLVEETGRIGRIPTGALRAYADEILAMTEQALREPVGSGGPPARNCPVAEPLDCVTDEPCR